MSDKEYKRAYDKQYKLQHQDKIKEQRKIYQEKNKEIINEKKKIYYQQHRDKFAEKSKVYRDSLTDEQKQEIYERNKDINLLANQL